MERNEINEPPHRSDGFIMRLPVAVELLADILRQ